MRFITTRSKLRDGVKKESLIKNMPEKLHELTRFLNETSHLNFKKDNGDGK